MGHKILGYPVRIDSKLYARNAFYFNLCFVFEPRTRTIGYEPIIKKLSEYLLTMELNNKSLSNYDVNNPDANKLNLKTFFERILHDINSKKMSILQEGSTVIPLCVVPHYKETIKINAHQAPVLIENFHKFVRAQWDLTTLRVSS